MPTSNTFFLEWTKLFPTVYLNRMFGRVDATVYLQNCVNTRED